MSDFNYLGARQAGYSDDEIAKFLAEQQGFDFDGAASAGYNSRDVVSFLLSQSATAPSPKPGSDMGRLASAGGSLALGVGGSAAGMVKGVALEGKPDERVFGTLDSIDAGEAYQPLAQRMAGVQAVTGARQLSKAEDPFEAVFLRYQEATPEERQGIRQELRSEAEGVFESPFYKAGESIDNWFADTFKTNPEYAGEFWADDVPRALGSAFTFLAAAALTRRLSPAALELPMSYAAPAALGGLANASEVFEDALASGADISTALSASELGSIIGLSEAIPVGNLLNRVDAASGGQVKKYLIRALKEGTEEAVQEAFVGVMNAAIAQDMYDPERGIWTSERGEEAVLGFTTGAILETLMTLASPGRRRGTTPGQPDQEAPPEVAPDTFVPAPQVAPAPTGVEQQLAAQERLSNATNVDEAIQAASDMIGIASDIEAMEQGLLASEMPAPSEALQRLTATFDPSGAAAVTPEAQRLSTAFQQVQGINAGFEQAPVAPVAEVTPEAQRLSSAFQQVQDINAGFEQAPAGAPRPTKIAGAPASQYTEDQLQALIADESLAPITRRGAQIELSARAETAPAQPTEATVSEKFISIPEALPDAVTAAESFDSAAARAAGQQAIDEWAQREGFESPVTMAEPPAELGAQVEEIAELIDSQWGGRVVPFFDDRPDAINGVAIGQVAYVNTALSQAGVQRTALHEFKHTVEQIAEAELAAGLTNTPAQEFVEQIDSVFDDITDKGKRSYVVNFLAKEELEGLKGEAREAKIQDILQSPLLRSEMVADFLGNRATDKKFWQEIAQADPTGFEGFVKRWLAAIDNLLATLRGAKNRERTESAKVDKYIRDLNRAKMTAQSALINYRKATIPSEAPATAAPAFSKRENVDSLVKLENVFRVAESGDFKTNRELKVFLQDRVQAAAKELKLDLKDREYLVRVGVADALYALQSNANAVGWYDKTVTEALDILGLIHPELNTDQNARFAFIWGLAVTSNGIKVDKNFELAEYAYEYYKRKGKMPTNITAGNAQKAINSSMKLFNTMVDKYGIDDVRDFMLTEFTVSEIKKATGLEVSGESANTVVRGAAILGPKIGNGFFSNLNGFFDQLTMDRWLMRTWGRWTGTLIDYRPDMVKAKRQELREVVQELKKNAPAASEIQKLLGRKLTVGDPDALAVAILKTSMKPENREILNKTAAGEKLRKVGNALAKYLDGQKEAPKGPLERQEIRAVFSDILTAVQEKGYNGLTMSDLQALVWYPERRLYDAAKTEEGAAEEGYADDEAPDYANAAAKLARSKGVSESEIQGVRDGRATRARRDDGIGAVESDAERGVQGFTEKQRRKFLTTGYIHRFRSDSKRGGEASGAYKRRSPGDGGSARVLGQPVTAVYTPQVKLKNLLGDAGAPVFNELASDGAALFQDAIVASKEATPFGAAVYVYPLEEYQDMRLFISDDASAGFALKGDDIVSVFSRKPGSGAVNGMLQLAVQQGGRRLDAFDTVLPDLYAPHGFKTVARQRWNEDQRPEGWNKETFKKYNNGEPDAVYMVYDENYFGKPGDADGRYVDSDADTTAIQREAIRDDKTPRFSKKQTDQRATGDRGRRDPGRGDSQRAMPPLPDAPRVEGATGPDPRIVAVAEQYARDNGIAYARQGEYVEVDTDRAERIAQAYADMPHAPQDPRVKEAYQNMIDQTVAQYEALVDAGYQFYFFDSSSDPYDGNPWNAMRDLRQNQSMSVYGTYDGYGTEGLTQGAVEGNPMLEDTGLEWPDQDGVMRPVLANDLFRAVHDAFGHGLEGAGFRARGEENAWQAHARLFTGSALGALTSETRGQNSWLNYGPYGEVNRDAKVEDTVFADQKTGLMPEWTWMEGRADDAAEPRFSRSESADAPTVIRLGQTSNAKANAAIAALREKLSVNPINPTELMDGDAAVTVSAFNGSLHISDIRSTAPGQGAASRLLDKVLAEADAANVRTTLFASNYGESGLSTQDLVKWYERRGFDVIDESDDGVEMRRFPNIGQDDAVSTDASAADQNIMFSRRQKPAPENTVKAYKLFRVDPRRPGQLFPLFVDANTPVPIGEWQDAEIGEQTDTGKVKSKLGPLAFRPGWHAGDLPVATHIGSKSDASRTAPDRRPANQVWAEVELAADRDWQQEANRRGRNAAGKVIGNRAHITDQIPEDGFYRYKTNPNMTGNWLISGSMKVNRVLSDAEVERINRDSGASDLPRETPFDFERFGFDAPAFSRRQNWYRSELSDNVGKVRQMANKQGLIDPKIAKSWIASKAKSGLFKQAEVDAVLLNEWLDTQSGKIPVEDIEAYVRQGGVQIEETVLGGDYETYPEGSWMEPDSGEVKSWTEWEEALIPVSDSEEIPLDELMDTLKDVSGEPVDPYTDEAKYKKYQLDEGSNYREILLTLPAKKTSIQDLAKELFDSTYEELDNDQKNRLDKVLDSRRRNAWKRNYQSSHWDIPNVLAHARVNDRVDSQGDKVLFVEEVQSDWAQEGREEGFKKEFTFEEELDRARADLMFALDNDEDNLGFDRTADAITAIRDNADFADRWEMLPETAALGNRYRELFEEKSKAEYGVPDAPFVKDTKSWTTLTLKRLINDAVENGYDKLAFISGQQSADRYALEKVVNHLDYEPAGEGLWEIEAIGKNDERVFGRDNMSLQDISETFGREIADLISADSGRPLNLAYRNWSRLEGVDLKTGGKGMIAFYDQIVPAALKDIVKKYGGKLGRSTIETGTTATKKYSGPEGTVDQINALIRLIHSADGTIVSPITGKKQTLSENVFPRLFILKDEMMNGKPFSEAITRVDTTREIADLFGGKIDNVFESKTTEQLSLEIDDKLRSSVDQGFPLFSRRSAIGGPAPLASFTTPQQSVMKDDFIRKWQNRFIDLKRITDQIQSEKGITLDDKFDPYLQEELFHKRAASKVQAFAEDELRPMLEAMTKEGVNLADLETYLHNRHAEERNKQIAKINPKMPDKGSGIATADARNYLSGLSPEARAKFEKLADYVDNFTRGTRQLLVSSGLESQDTVDAWENTYQYYVPLMRDDVDFIAGGSSTGTGAGYDVRGPSSRRAMGSERDVVDLFANLVMQREKAITRAEKNRVAMATYGMTIQHANPEYWLPVNPDAKPSPAAKQNLINELIAMGLTPADAKSVIEEPKVKTLDPKTGLVVERLNPRIRGSDNVLALKVNGKDRFVFFNQNNAQANGMVRALKNLELDNVGPWLRAMGVGSRYFASINTQYNPVFGVVNLARDSQAAMMQLSTTPLAGEQTKVAADIAPALKGIYRAVRANRDGRQVTGQWEDLFKRFQDVGGQTGYRDLYVNSEERAKALQAEIAKISEGKTKQAGRAIFGWLSDYNDAMENAVRLAAFKAAIDKGLSDERAASLAKNLTVNFNRKGDASAQAGSLYAFFNAAVQGTTRMAETLQGPAGKKILAGGLLLGSAQAMLLAFAGFEEDEPPVFVKERNLVIPLFNEAGGYLTMPMPLGYNVIPNTSRVLTEWFLSGFEDSGKRLMEIGNAFFDMFNPIGSAGLSLQTIAPTVFDPIVALAENRDWTGKPIYREDFSSLDPTPGYQRARATASVISKELSYYINLLTGGTAYQKGGFSPTPDQLDYLAGQLGGGVARESLKLMETIESLITGEDLPPYKIPLGGRVYGRTTGSAAEASRFYANIRRMNAHDQQVKGLIKDRLSPRDYIQKNPEARLTRQADRTYREIQNLNRRKREMLERGASRESIKMIELQIERRMARFNEQVRSASS